MKPNSRETIPGKEVKLCYCDESGMGNESVAVMVGIVVDATRMHLTKAHWKELLDELSRITGRQVAELHARDFYSGRGVFHKTDGKMRSEIISAIYRWLAERKHHVVYASVLKESYDAAKLDPSFPPELNTVWRYLGFHLVLAMQRYCQSFDRNKGHTIYVFDNENREEVRFTDVVLRPQAWSDEYYERRTGQPQLDQLVDVPYFCDSRNVALIQLADLFSYFLRRHAEIERGEKIKYEGEAEKVSAWVKGFSERSIGRQHIYPRKNRNWAQNLFFKHAPPSIRDLG